MEGLTDLSEVPKDLVFEARRIFFESKEQVRTSCKKKEMKIEFRLLGDILAKTISVKAGSFDAVTHEWFLLMTAIICGVKINWSSLVFDILKAMVPPGSRQAKGYAIQICVLLKNVLGLELCESRAFPSSRILTEKTVHRYVVINEKVGGEEVADAPRVKKTPVKKAASKKRPDTDAAAEPVMIAPTPVAPAEQPPVPKRKTQKRKRKLILSPDDKIVDTFVQYSLFSGLSTADISSFVSTIAFERTVLRDVQIAQSSISVAPSVQMMIDQSPFSSSTSDDSSMHFDDNDTADTSISLPPAATDFMEYLAKLRASVDQVQCEQFRCRDDAHNLRNILLVHIQDLEHKISARVNEQDRVHRALRKDMHDKNNLSSLDLKSTHQKLSAQIAAAAFDTVDVRKEVKEINAKITYLDGQVAEIRSEKLDFRAKAEENYLNLSTQLGLIVDYLRRGDAKKGESGSNTVDVRKEVKEINAKITYLDGQVAEIRSEKLDFRAKAEENYLNLSTQLGLIVDYLRRGDAKKGESGSNRPQPPPGDQSRPSEGSGGSGNRLDEQRSGTRESGS
ncbi:protein lava lamp [Dorcoceras hygrometricum]|uniref:Protein lava lamp n=1 Tax=Dorcoceras hygrometricum TaxID=472368 RepID=A0A2Z7AUM0_9LAMI|nr:protein lava lamp [Dorcoceras hygrometricum]